MESSASTPHLRYAVLWHAEVDEPHYDFLIETRPGSDLATWRLPRWPIDGVSDAIRLKDHRRIYLDYEGALSLHRGRVERIDGGVCQVDIGEDAVWTVSGIAIMPKFVLRRMDGELWEFRS